MRKFDENYLKNIPDLAVKKDVKFSSLTTVGCGGIAPVVAEPTSLAQLKAVISILRGQNIPFELLGGGSNCLAQDGVYKGIIVRIGHKFSGVKFVENTAEILAGTPLSYLSFLAEKRGLSGLEFARSLPAKTGGAVVSNCGCYGQEMSKIITCVTATNGQEIRRFTAEECCFSYRNSCFVDNGYAVAVAEILLEKQTPEKVAQKTQTILTEKRKTQPLSFRSAGSVFKRSEGVIPPLLIQECGLKGYQIGGARVSEKHCGFIVNVGMATTADFVALIKLIRTKVYEKFGVKLQREIKYIGEIDDFG